MKLDHYPKLLQLYSLRAQVEAIIAQEEAEMVTVVAGCPHPEEKRRASHNMGQEPEFICMACGETVKGVV